MRIALRQLARLVQYLDLPSFGGTKGLFTSADEQIRHCQSYPLASVRPSRHRCFQPSASQARRSVTSMGRSPRTSCALHSSAARRAARNSSPLRTPICGNDAGAAPSPNSLIGEEL